MLDRTVAPAASAIVRPNLPVADVITLGQLEASVLNQGSQPVILLEIVIPVGRWQETTPGLAFYTFKMITEGTKSKSAEEIASAFEYYGAHIEVTPTLDHVSVKLYVLNKFLDKVLHLFVETLTESSFPEKEFDTMKQIRLEQIKQQNARNNAFANLKFREMLFGASHPYGLIIEPAMAQNVTLDQLKAFSSHILTKPEFFISGLVTDEVLQTIQQAFGHLKFNSVSPIKSSEINPVKRLEITREDSTQASIRIGHLTIDRNHQDIHHFKVANTLLGGFFGSRLMKNIREDKGLTYGIHSGILHMDHASYWSISSEVLREKADLALEEIYKEITKLKTEPAGQHEFEMMRNYLKGKFLSSFDSPFNSHETIKALKLAKLTSENLYDYLDVLDKIQPTDICEVMSKHISTDPIELLVY